MRQYRCTALHGRIPRTEFRQRMRRALYAAHAAGSSTIILGAWGCGAFRNRAGDVADLWSEVLDTLEWRGRFYGIVFAVPHGRRGCCLLYTSPSPRD